MREYTIFKEFLQQKNFSAYVVATLSKTEGSTYHKAGVKKIIAPDGSSVGLISGGCLESEIVQRALAGMGASQTQVFDTTDDTDRLFGYGLGCQGKLFVDFETCSKEQIISDLKNLDSAKQFWVKIFGAGPDIEPLKELLAYTGWHHQFFTAQSDGFLKRKSASWPIEFIDPLKLNLEIQYPERTAVLLMSHNYSTDLAVLSQLVNQVPAYVGVLGPVERKNRMLADLNKIYKVQWPEGMLDRVYGPIGILGLGRGESAIALSVVTQLQQIFFGESR